MNIFQFFFILQEKNSGSGSYFEILLKPLLWVAIGKADRLLARRMEDTLLFSLPIVA